MSPRPPRSPIPFSRVDPPSAAARRRLLVAGAIAFLPMRCLADVVPQPAVDVAAAWLALVDRGRYREAVDRYFDADRAADGRALVARLSRAGAPPTGPKRRSIGAWAGHGAGDQSRMAPGAYFSLTFDRVDASPAATTDEVRLVPRGDRWRVVGYETRR